MNMKEYNLVKGLNYYDYCVYLQKKYGEAQYDYMTKTFNKNTKVTRTSEGLIAHHKMEIHMIMLSTKEIAEKCPFEWQQKQNIIYCDYLEHLLLHILISETPEPILPNIDVGTGGVVNFLVPELNDFYSGWRPSTQWQKNCLSRVENDEDVYLELIHRFLHNNHNVDMLYSSAGEAYGTWRRKNNKALFKKFK